MKIARPQTGDGSGNGYVYGTNGIGHGRGYGSSQSHGFGDGRGGAYINVSGNSGQGCGYNNGVNYGECDNDGVGPWLIICLLEVLPVLKACGIGDGLETTTRLQWLNWLRKNSITKAQGDTVSLVHSGCQDSALRKRHERFAVSVF